MLELAEPEPEELLVANVGGENCCVLTLPIVLAAPLLKRLIPSCWSFVLSTSANLTSSKICCSCSGATVSEFTTPALYAAAIFPTSSENSGRIQRRRGELAHRSAATR